MYDIIKSGVNLPIAFRSWYWYANLKLGYGSQHSWNVKLSANREKPIFSLIGFTLNGELITNNLSNLKAHMSSESYPYDNLNVDLNEMKCIKDFNLVTIIVNHNHFWPQVNLNWRPLLLWLIFHIKTNQWKLVLLMWEFQ